MFVERTKEWAPPLVKLGKERERPKQHCSKIIRRRITMSDKQSFSDGTRQYLSDLKTSVERSEKRIQLAITDPRGEPQRQRDETVAFFENRRQEIEAAHARAETHRQAKMAETKAKVDEWKANLDVQRLENRAIDAEDYANETYVIASGAIDEATAAALDAIDARMAADEAAGKRRAA